MENCKLVAYYVDETTVNGMGNDMILKMKGPDKNHSDNVVLMGNWCEDVLSILCSGSTSNFMNMRTFCRDFGNSLFFQDLPILFEQGNCCTGQSVPLEVLFYSCLNSFMENSCSMLNFYHVFNVDSINNSDIMSGLRVVRDCLAPWTFCCYEGLYTSDVSLKQNVEDQPFPFSFVKGRRIFQRDDCEGRVCEAHVMAELFKNFYRLVSQESSIGNCQHEIYMYAKYYYDKGGENTRIDISFDTWCNLLAVCFYIGKLFHDEVLEIHTTVGDVNFAAFNGETVDSDSKKLVGHSFGILVFHDSRQKKHTCVLECTGWERIQISSDIPLTEKELSFMREIVKLKLDSSCPLKINICGYLSQEKEESVYENICLGTRCIFFSVNKSKESQASKMDFGTSLKNLRNGRALDYEHLRDNTLSNFEKDYIKKSENVSLKVNTRDFLGEMCSLSNFLEKKTDKAPVLCFFNWLNIENLCDGDKEKLGMCMKRVFDIKKIHSDYENGMSKIRECLGTPPKNFSNYLMLMKNNWKVLHYKNSEEDHCRGIRFSIRLKDENSSGTSCDDIIYSLMKDRVDMDSFVVERRPFMHSIVYNVYQKQV